MENTTTNVEAQGAKRKQSKLSVLKQLAGSIRNLIEEKLITKEETETLNKIRERLRKEVIGEL